MDSLRVNEEFLLNSYLLSPILLLLSVCGGKWWLLGDVEALCTGQVVPGDPGAVGASSPSYALGVTCSQSWRKTFERSATWNREGRLGRSQGQPGAPCVVTRGCAALCSEPPPASPFWLLKWGCGGRTALPGLGRPELE